MGCPLHQRTRFRSDARDLTAPGRRTFKQTGRMPDALHRHPASGFANRRRRRLQWTFSLSKRSREENSPKLAIAWHHPLPRGKNQLGIRVPEVVHQIRFFPAIPRKSTRIAYVKR